MQSWLAWIESHSTGLGWLVLASAVMFFGTLLLVPAMVVRIPRDYFAHQRRPPAAWLPEHPVLRTLAVGVKNLCGGLLLLVGIAMLVLPGQGLLTMLLGVMLLDFPGKYRLERWLVGRGPTLRMINWLRRRSGQPPLERPTQAE